MYNRALIQQTFIQILVTMDIKSINVKHIEISKKEMDESME